MNLLISSAGRRVELVELFRGLCGGDVVAADCDRTAPALYHATAAVRTPRADAPDFIPTVAEICRQYEIGLVVPTIDPELLIYAASIADFEAAGTRVAVPSLDSVMTAGDKLAACHRFASVGLLTIPTELWTEGLPTFSLPCVVKPRFGAAGRGVRTLEDASAWTPPPKAEQWVVQPLMKGREVTVDCVAGPFGKILALGARERLKIRGGEVERARTVEAERYLPMAASLSRCLGIEGIFNFQVFEEAGTAHVAEVNPRVGGGLPLSQQAGATLLETVISWAETGAWPSHPTVFASSGVHMLRYDASIFLTSEELAWR